MAINWIHTRLRRYLVNSGLEASMPAVQECCHMYNQCTAVSTTIPREPKIQVFQPPIQSMARRCVPTGAFSSMTMSAGRIAIIPSILEAHVNGGLWHGHACLRTPPFEYATESGPPDL